MKYREDNTVYKEENTIYKECEIMYIPFTYIILLISLNNQTMFVYNSESKGKIRI